MPSKNSQQGATAPSDSVANPLEEGVAKHGIGGSLVSDSPRIPKNFRDHMPAGNMEGESAAKRFRNPNGYPGLAGIKLHKAP